MFVLAVLLMTVRVKGKLTHLCKLEGLYIRNIITSMIITVVVSTNIHIAFNKCVLKEPPSNAQLQFMKVLPSVGQSAISEVLSCAQPSKHCRWKSEV